MSAVRRVVALGVTVIMTFSLLWWPFVTFGPEDTDHLDRLLQVLHRIFPFQRGLFEGKVTNLWCALSVKPFRIRQRIPADYQPLAALALTIVLMAPSCYKLFQIGKRNHPNNTRILLHGMTSCSLAFFLASFQVHEKSLLIALAPATLLDDSFADWFSIVVTWTLWPLLQIDRLQVPYVCTLLLFIVGIQLRHDLSSLSRPRGFFEQQRVLNRVPILSYEIMTSLHIAEVLITPLDHLPDLFAVLWSITGCGFCVLA